MRMNFKKENRQDLEKTEQLLSSISAYPRKDFENELEQKLFLALEQKQPPKNKNFMFHYFTWKKLLVLMLPLALLVLVIAQPNVVSAKLSQVIKAGKKLLFEESQFIFQKDKNIPGTYMSFSSLLEGKNLDSEARDRVQKNKKNIERLIDLSPLPVKNILLREGDYDNELYIVLLDKNNEPIIGGVIPKSTDMPSQIDLMSSICEKIEYEKAVITTSTAAYIYSNPNWGLQYQVPREKGVDEVQMCGGGSGFAGIALRATTHFSKQHPFTGYIAASVTFPEENIADDYKKLSTVTVLGNIQGYLHEEADEQNAVHKTFVFSKNGFLYTFEYEAQNDHWQEYDKRFNQVINSIQISEPLMMSNYPDESAFLKVYSNGKIYTLKNNTWELTYEKKETPPGELYAPIETAPELTDSEVSVDQPKLREDTKIPISNSFIYPTKSHSVNQYFGERHSGLDLEGKQGEDILAASAGTVSVSQCGWNGGYGCYIILDHGQGVTSLYANNDTLNVSIGDKVTAGQIIAKLGSTGHSTGPHLHFEIRVNDVAVNPLFYLPPN